ncbi:hypothetical protein [Sphingomonas bacterium]|uniref:hypothetical protein n=1 Tax=Sphingomonas bacterium TaxID=1895847 RepID=UPI002617AABC|nr:hypothetical protein [Sphingomonas bacterium]MDB5678356.1 hypothetical protein [Sphingomonas bacterium]
MRRTILAGASLMALAACSVSSDPVGENSAGSIKTTAVGNVVATIPSPTPTPTSDAVSVDNAASSLDAMTNDSM